MAPRIDPTHPAVKPADAVTLIEANFDEPRGVRIVDRPVSGEAQGLVDGLSHG